MAQTIFFGVFNSGSMRHDRRMYCNELKSLKDFHFWLEEKRTEIEKQYSTSVLVENIQYITAADVPDADEINQAEKEGIVNLEHA